MGGLLKKIMPISRSMSGKDFTDDFNPEFSIALEYTGSPVNHSLPRAFPVDIDQIPTAKVAVSPAFVNNLSLTVVQPISRRNIRVTKEVRLASTVDDLKNQTTPLEKRLSDHDCWGIDGSGVLTNENSVGKRDDREGLSGDLEEDFPKCYNGNETSGSLGFSDSRDHSHELSESSDMVGTPRDCEGIEGFRNCVKPGDLDSNEHNLVPQAFPAEITCEEEESDGEALECRRRKRCAVTFCDYDSGEGVYQEYESRDDIESFDPERPVAKRPEKRGQCYYCHKGNRFTLKEACIVCNAKYCRRCVLRVMGSMPEGRKCITCLGFSVDESSRHVLGKCSRMLKTLFHESEVRRIMEFELSCECIYVNGSPLSGEKLKILQNCPNPPRNLKPGKYWYDKVAGFWGKEGHKPCQIVTAQLNVWGNGIRRDASNGNGKVFINDREITKEEVWMLQSAGVQCAGKPNFLVYPDGSYEEEGMGRVKGNIWSRKRTKLLCTLLSLPTPKSPKPQEKSDDIVDRAQVSRILLVGNDKSGTSTIYKQARVLYEAPFSEEERENMKVMIQSSLYGYLGRILEGREQFEEESATVGRQSSDQPGPSAVSSAIQDKTGYTIGKRSKAFSDWLINIVVSGNLDIVVPAAREWAPCVEELWKDAAIQATYSRRDELGLPRVASYFLDRAIEIAKADYEPTDTDILYAEGITTCDGLVSMGFSFRDADQDVFRNGEEQPDRGSQYQLVRVHTKSLGEDCKWLDMFDDVGIVLFCVSLAEYDEYEVNSSGVLVNKMLESKRLFEKIITHPVFEKTNFLLILNKFDLLEEKIYDVPLTKCEWFPDFNPVISRHHSRSNRNNMAPLTQTAFHYIGVKFKQLFTSLTGRKLYVCPVTALESDTVDSALRYAREILRWEDDKPNFSLNESSCESIEQTTDSIIS